MGQAVIQEGGRHDLTIRQGGRFRYPVRFRGTDGLPVDISAYRSARAQFRASAASPTVLYEASTANGHLSLDQPNATVWFDIPATASAAWTFTTAVYDLELVGATEADVLKLIGASRVKVVPEVTR